MSAKPKDAHTLENIVNSVFKCKLYIFLFAFTVWIWFFKTISCGLLPNSSKVQANNHLLSVLHEMKTLSKAGTKCLNNNEVLQALSTF